MSTNEYISFESTDPTVAFVNNMATSLGNTSWSTTTDEPVDPHAESTALFYFRRIVPGILLLIGVPGNFLSMAVMMRPFFRSTSAGLYLFVLLVADTAFLFSNYSFIFWLINNFKTFELVYSTISCKLWVYISEVSGFISSWILVTLTIERAIVISNPHKSSVVCTRKRAGIAIAVICGSMLLVNTYVLVTFAAVPNGNPNPIRPQKSCFFMEPYSKNLGVIVAYHLGPFFIYSVIPTCCILVANIIVMYKMKRRPEITVAKGGKKRDTETKKVTFLLMAASAFFLLSTFPMTTLVFLENVLKFLNPKKNLVLYEVYRYVMVLMPLNQSFNFVVYCISGSSFRRELKAMFRECCKKVSCPKCRRKRKSASLPGMDNDYWCRINHVSIDRGTSSSGVTENTYL